MAADFGSEAHRVDDRIICPSTQEVCVARESLVRAFESSYSNYHDDLPPEVHPSLDGPKLQLRLAEYDYRGAAVDCSEAAPDQCPVRESMDQSVTRTTVVSGIRRMLGRSK